MMFNGFFTAIHFEMEEINCTTDNETRPNLRNIYTCLTNLASYGQM